MQGSRDLCDAASKMKPFQHTCGGADRIAVLWLGLNHKCLGHEADAGKTGALLDPKFTGSIYFLGSAFVKRQKSTFSTQVRGCSTQDEIQSAYSAGLVSERNAHMSAVAVVATTAMVINPIHEPKPSKKYPVAKVLTEAAIPLRAPTTP